MQQTGSSHARRFLMQLLLLPFPCESPPNQNPRGLARIQPN
jgi:hypothetical protein